VGTATFDVEVVDTTAPVLDVPEDVTAEATGPDGAAVTFAAHAHDLVSGDVAVHYDLPPGMTFPLGLGVITASATDEAENTSRAIFTVSVVDTTPPALTLPGPLVVEATGPSGAAVTYAASAQDLVSGSVPVTLMPPSGSTFPFGTTSVQAEATDAAGNHATGTFTVTVGDATAPAFVSLSASPNVLWPPNHKMVPVTIAASVTDAVTPAPLVRIVAVSSNEPADGTGDGHTSSDGEVTGALTLLLRAERSGNGSGRIYTITVETVDAAGNAARRLVTVSVPRSR
jgi:hypothetical protein